MQPNAIELRAALAAPICIHRSIPGVKTLLYAGPGARIEQHEHGRPFITFLLHGMSDESDARGRVQRIGSGTLNYTPQGTRHAHHFISEWCSTLCAELSPALVALADDHQSELDHAQMIRSGAAVEVAHRISLELLAADDASNLVLQGLFIELVGEIIRSPGDAMTGAPAWLSLACSMLRESPINSLTVQDVAAEVAVHPSHLAKCFRKFVGQSPGEFARNARLERASRDLHHTPKPLKVIASEAGFGDQAHFTRAFKRAFGYVPSAARRGLSSE